MAREIRDVVICILLLSGISSHLVCDAFIVRSVDTDVSEEPPPSSPSSSSSSSSSSSYKALQPI